MKYRKLNNKNRPALVSKDNGRGIYKLKTDADKKDYIAYIKCQIVQS